MPQSARLDKLVADWLRLDKNPTTRSEIQQLWDNGDWDELERRMGKRIEFGTAGLRAKMEGGWARMNDLIIIQAAQGLAAHLSTLPEAAKRGVVVGHDHRHNSERWANLTARAFLLKGIRVYLFKGVVHTPLVPFGVKKLGAVGGVMVTASHNPAEDNGWKVYYENAVQIIPPFDGQIAQAINDNLEPEEGAWDAETVREHSLCEDKTNVMRYEYHSHIAALFPPEEYVDLKLTHTAFHGLADLSIARAFAYTGLPPLHSVRAQRDPDPDFPTLAFPNPEEKGALSLALQTAELNDSEFILANDPDADRFLAAEKTKGSWHIFTGDELGALLASFTLEEYRKKGKPIEKLAMVASTVSSKMLGAMAAKEGFRFEDCLTGFKYIGNRALELEAEGYSVDFLYEEAIGYAVSPYIRDKDGITAAIAFVRLAARLATRGSSPLKHLRELYEKYGYFVTSNSYFRSSDTAVTKRIFDRLRAMSKEGKGYPTRLGPFPVQSVRDLTEGYAYDSSQLAPEHKPVLPLSSGNMITFSGKCESGEGFVLTIRTSGTEPKIKYYLEGNGRDPDGVKGLLEEAEKALADDWMQAEENGLGGAQA